MTTSNEETCLQDVPVILTLEELFLQYYMDSDVAIPNLQSHTCVLLVAIIMYSNVCH